MQHYNLKIEKFNALHYIITFRKREKKNYDITFTINRYVFIFNHC